MATTTNYGWETPDDTDLVKDGAAAIRTLGTAIDTTVYSNASASIAKTLIDAKGDLIVGSAADTAARLAVGTNDYVLTADSTATNGIAWKQAAGGAGNLAVVASGTLSGSSLTLSSLSTYSELILALNGVTNGSVATVRVRINNNSTSNYENRVMYVQTTSLDRDQDGNYTYITRGDNFNQSANDGNNNFVVKLTNCKSTGFTDYDQIGYSRQSSAGAVLTGKGTYKVSEAVSSLYIYPSAGSFTGGAYVLWGA